MAQFQNFFNQSFQQDSSGQCEHPKIIFYAVEAMSYMFSSLNEKYDGSHTMNNQFVSIVQVILQKICDPYFIQIGYSGAAQDKLNDIIQHCDNCNEIKGHLANLLMHILSQI